MYNNYAVKDTMTILYLVVYKVDPIFIYCTECFLKTVMGLSKEDEDTIGKLQLP